MPGPGGGSHGGGGSRGGGGGFSRGGFHGGHHGGFHHTGWHFRPRRSRFGGGCLGAIFAPFIMILMAVFMLIQSFAPAANHQSSSVNYDSGVLQDYADQQYQAHFGSSGNYEDHLLLLFLTYEDEYSYDYIAWVGDHIVKDINLMMGDNDTALGRAMANSVNDTSYRYSLDSNLAIAVDEMTEQIAALGLESSFSCQESHYTNSTVFSNLTALSMTEETVYDALTRFTEQTGISIALVVDEATDVFGESKTGSNIIITLLGAVLLILAVVFIVKALRNSKKTRSDEYDGGRRNYDEY